MSTEKETQVLSGKGALEDFFNGVEAPVEQPKDDKPQTVTEFFSEEEPEKETLPAAEPKKPEVTDPEPPKQTTSSNTSFYKDLVTDFISEGDWEDVAIELEEGQPPVNISDIEEITPELFKQLKSIQNEFKKEEINSKYISVEGLSETDKKIIELKKKGGDITPLLQIQTQHVHPLEGLDLDDEKTQEHLVRQKLAYKGLHPQTIQAEIDRLKKEVALDVEAKKIVDEVNTNFQAIVQKDLEARNAEIEKEQEEQKKFRKTMSETLKTFSLKDSLTKTLLDNSTKYDENGITNVDKLYFQSKENPELYAKLNLLLTDEKAFDEFFGTKIKNKATVQTVQKVFKVHPKNSGTAAVTPKKTDNPVEEFFSSK